MSIFADEFLDMMPHTVSVERFLGRADDGKASFGPPTDYRARVNMKTHNVLNAMNQLVVANGMAWLATVDPIKADDRITLPDGSKPIILVANVTPDENGDAYTRLDFQ